MNRPQIRLTLHFGFSLLLALVVTFAADDTNVIGGWVFTNLVGFGTAAPTPSTNGMTIQQTGNQVKGTLTVPRGGDCPLEGVINGSNIEFSVRRHTEAGDVVVEYKGTVQGATMHGTYRVRGQQSGTDIHWTAERSKT